MCAASVGRILVSDKTFNTPIIAIHCGNAQNVGFENPTYAKLKKAACTFQFPKCRLLFCSQSYCLFNNDPRIQRLYRAVVV